MTRPLLLTLIATMLSLASFAVNPITGPTVTCVGSHITLNDSSASPISWTSSNPSVATVSGSGMHCVVYGVSAGTTTISFTDATGVATLILTVNSGIGPISGASAICKGTTTPFSNASPGGTWSCLSGVATVGATTGVVSGVSGGLADITYTLGACNTTKSITINATTTGYIAGDSIVCAGTTQTLSNTIGGGTWTSSNPSVASVGITSGVITTLSAGVAIISYNVTGICGPDAATMLFDVSNTTPTPSISGPSTMIVGTTAGMSAFGTVTSWASSNPSVATVASGIVTGVAVGSTTISVTTTGCGGPAIATHALAVIDTDLISGHIFLPGSLPCSYNSKVWLIKYDPVTMILSAVDSTYTNCGALMIPYYEFIGVATGLYRVKAADDTIGIGTGHIPTYHDSSFYWYDASVVSHTAGSIDSNVNIYMLAGTATSGPGFIGGSVLTGANKGTSGALPVVGLRMILLNSSNKAIKSTRTNAAGNYIFNSLPAGTYTVFPDSLNYLTTPYTSITLSTSAPSMNVASFRQHTLSGTITPIETAVSALSNISSITVLPNPASNKLTLQWTAASADNGTVTITDITGREIYSSAISFAAGTGAKTVDLSSFTNGMYLVSVRSASASYTTKVQVQH